MSALVRTELLKLLVTRTTWVFVAVALLLGGLRVQMVLGSVGTVGAPEAGTAELTTTVLAASLTGTVMVLLLGVVLVTGELRHATLTSTLLTTPDRNRVLVAKVLAAAVVGAVLATFLLVLGAAVGAASGDLSGRVDGQVAVLVVGGVLGSACWGWIGVAIGALVRHQTAALLVPVVWILVVETLLPAFGLRALVPWTPVGATSALAGSDFAGALPVWAAGLVLVGYGVLLTLPGARWLTRADVT